MKFVRSIINFLLLFSVPAMSCPQIPEEPIAPISIDWDNLQENSKFQTYDDLLAYLERVENEDLESICSPQDLSRLNLFMAHLAETGLLSQNGEDADELHRDIQDLLSEDEDLYSFAYALDGRAVVPARLYGNGYETILCKSWIKKTCKKIKKFVKKHKTEILVGAAVIVTVIVVVATAGAAAGAGAAVAGAAASAAEASESSKETRPTVQEVIEERVSDFKEAVAEEIPPSVAATSTTESLGETIRKMGSSLAHETLNGVAAVVSVVPTLVDEVSDLSQKTGLYNQDNDSTLFSNTSALEHFKEMTKTGHEYIDSAFSTQMAEKYSMEEKASSLHKRDMKIGIIPVFSGACGSVPLTGRIAPTQANPIKGWAVGQDIKNLTAEGKVPKWRAVRSRYWKNKAELARSVPEKYPYTPDQVKRMEKGLAPQQFNRKKGAWESKELHHDPAQRDGGLFDFIEVWPEDHANLDSYRYIGN